MAAIIEVFKIHPPPDTIEAFSLPIVFLDMLWYGFGADPCVLFFDFPGCSRSNFLDAIVPDVKASLSLALGHFLPLAGNIIHPLSPGDRPILRYESGDSVCLTVCESSADFNQLTGNSPRSCDGFYDFAPVLPAATRSEKSISCPVLALQITLFPGQGLCVGFVTHHAVADASTVVSFIQAWALINRSSNLDNALRQANLLPFYDRKTVANVNGLDSIYWDLIVRQSCRLEPPPVKLPTNKVRATFLLKEEEIQNLKKLVLEKCPRVAHLSSFTIACALFWFCSAKSGGEEAADDEPEYFFFAADCRHRLEPPLPANYFGNCVSLLTARLKHGELTAADGFVEAAKAVGEAIKDNVNNEKGILYGAERWPESLAELMGKRTHGVAGSPRFDFYAADYGWGKAKKYEPLFIDDGGESISSIGSGDGDMEAQFVGGGGSMSLNRSREGVLEIGLSKPMIRMDAFSKVWSEVLSKRVPDFL